MFDSAASFEIPLHPSPEEVASVLPYLPSSPNVLPRLCGLLHEDNVSLHQISSLLRLDPGLTARVLQMGNKHAAVRGLPCFTVEDAINQIGFDRIARMIARVAKEQVFVRPVSLYGVDADDFWRWSVSCALAAELLAERTGEDVSIAYTIGLLHSAGIVAIDEWALHKAPTLMFMSHGVLGEFMESERALLGFTQAEVGAALLHQWGFPVTMVEPMRSQYDPFSSVGYSRMACLLNAAKWLRSAVCAEDDSRPPRLPDPAILQPLRLNGERLSRLVVEIRIRLGEVRNLVDAIAA